KTTGKDLTLKPTARGWGFESCAIERSVSGVRAKSAPAQLKARSFTAVCRWKRSLLFLQSHESNNTNRKKIARRRSGGSSHPMRRTKTVNQQPTRSHVFRSCGQHVGCQKARRTMPA